MSYIIAMDGPAASGKGTISRGIAKELGITNLDTGAIYRCIALETIRNDITLEEPQRIVGLVDNIRVEYKKDGDIEKVYLNGEDVSKEIREPEITAITSPMSAIKELREKVNHLQRDMAKGINVIMEGRDIGTCIFPNADVKIYLDADVEERAYRRYKENVEKGIETTYDDVLEALKKRDYNDMNREVSPLKKADDAIIVDTTDMNIEETIEKVKEIIIEKLGDKI